MGQLLMLGILQIEMVKWEMQMIITIFLAGKNGSKVAIWEK